MQCHLWLSFHPLFFTRPAYRRGRCALVPVMPARPHNAISGILAGRIPGFGIVTFLLWHPTAHPCDVFGLFLSVSNGWPARYMAHKLPLLHYFSLRCDHDVLNIPLIASSFCVWLCCCSFLFVCGWLLLVCVLGLGWSFLLYISGTTSYDFLVITRTWSLLRYQLLLHELAQQVTTCITT